MESLAEAFERGRDDYEYFAHTILGRQLHPGQLEFLENAEATTNVLACANRYGKTTLIPVAHFHSCIYKKGAEPKYLNDDGTITPELFVRTKYETVHTAGEWELASDPWNESLKMISESPNLQAFVKDAPRSKPPHIDFIHGSRWKFRTLGNNAEGVDGKSIYLLTIDEAGWIANLQEMLNNVLRIRVADVRGRIWIIGTFKPGYSRDFYKIAVRAAASTGLDIGFGHQDEVETNLMIGGLDSSIRKYLEEFGIDLDEVMAASEEAEQVAI